MTADSEAVLTYIKAKAKQHDVAAQGHADHNQPRGEYVHSFAASILSQLAGELKR